MSEVITSSLDSGQILTISLQADFGEIIISTIFLAVVAIVVLDFTFGFVYRQ
jgi:hypothetical protein